MDPGKCEEKLEAIVKNKSFSSNMLSIKTIEAFFYR